MIPLALQCVMCARTATAQNAEHLNALLHGVLVLGIPPVLIGAAIVWFAWKRSS